MDITVLETTVANVRRNEPIIMPTMRGMSFS